MTSNENLPRPSDREPISFIPTDGDRPGPQPGMGLCLSGGGYRAMLFHLGTVWRLNETGLLGKVDRISSVSGGSITSAVLGMQWTELGLGQENGIATPEEFTRHLVEPIRGLAGRTIDAGAILGGILLPGTIGEKVENAYRKHLFGDATLQDLPGVGFVFTAEDLFAGIDLDNCIDESGQIKPWAAAILEQLDSYSEISPSGRGVKVFVRAAKHGARCKTGYEDGAIEIYDRGRFFTVTGRRLVDRSADVMERQAQVDTLYVQVFGDRVAPSVPPGNPSSNGRVHLGDEDILRLARGMRNGGDRVKALLAGDRRSFSSPSEADLSLVSTLAFYTKDAVQIDRIFRGTGLMRDKWHDPRGAQTYGQLTIDKALSTVTAQYRPRKKRKGGKPSGGVLDPNLGAIDPATGRLILSTQRTLPTAEAFVRESHHHAQGPTLRHYAGAFMMWRRNRYAEVEDGALRNRLLPWLSRAVRMAFDAGLDRFVAEDFPANPNTVNAALDSIRAYAHLPASTSSPSWLDQSADRPDAREIVACRSSLLHLPTMRTLPPTPAFFTVNALDYDHDPNAPPPKLWQTFMGQLFEDDLRSWDLLQEWFGYCLTGDTSQQKMLLIVGPRRSGKGTIARVLANLVGAGNVCGPATSSLAGTFGLQPLVGKSLAIVSDARFSGKNISTVIERLLCISGEDALTVDRKFLPSVTMKLPTRFMFLTNELPRLPDSSGALVGRFMVLRLTESFYGREDLALTDHLRGELPGILNWAIEGWRRLRERGHFLQPASVQDAVRELEELSSPVMAFVRACCLVDPDHRVWVDDLYEAWHRWCKADGRDNVTTKQTFGRDRLAAVSGVTSRTGTGNRRFYQGITLAPAP